MNTGFLLLEQPREARGFIHRRALGLVRRAFAPVIEAVVGSVPGAGVVRQGLKLARRGQGPAPLLVPSLAQPGRFVPRGLPEDRPVLPETPTITTPAERSIGTEFQAVTGAFGLPAMAPFAQTRIILDCPPGMVLGKDELCYPSAVLRRNSKFRKWRSTPRPTVTRRDERALSRIDSVQKALKRLGKKAGLKVTG